MSSNEKLFWGLLMFWGIVAGAIGWGIWG
ncbi:hypothetical protein QJV43_gp29 [Serratia phage Serbin]|uniref:Uncharacterized protein n=1 Tax=Serratia phage Serbin TaxID=2562181 RepID=A0A482MH16_9CAUD|nr:hypothetical protein QJV43_gp29 [Serratia phage Serbin]QBQ72945.1 hypothetical protein CPT_Serbin_029 [Serratia phage Serbin]